jgi:hypothetical protein
MNGWNMAFTGNINSTFGIKFEIAGAGYKTEYGVKYNDYSFTVGPQINGRFNAFPGTLFGHALFGVTRKGWNYEPLNYTGSDNVFAMTLGGGIEG